MSDNPHPRTLDVTGLLCPLPVLKARKLLNGMRPGEVLRILATDPMAAIDIPHFCQEQGHSLLSQGQEGSEFHFLVQRR